MNSYLASQNRNVSQMNDEERNQYQQQVNIRDRAAAIVADALVTLEKFCQSMRESLSCYDYCDPCTSALTQHCF